MTRIFFDFEFTGLHQNTTPVSLGMISDSGLIFYAEFADYDKTQVDAWLKENVIEHLGNLPKGTYGIVHNIEQLYSIKYMCEDKDAIRASLETWLNQFGQVEMWGDCQAYDWVLFRELWDGGPGCLPDNIYYIPFDLCTLLQVKGIDPDIGRIEFSGMEATKHNALDDARVIKACYEKLEGF